MFGFSMTKTIFYRVQSSLKFVDQQVLLCSLLIVAPQLWLWERRMGRIVQKYPSCVPAIQAGLFDLSPDEALVVAADGHRTLAVWDLHAAKLVRRLGPFPELPRAPKFAHSVRVPDFDSALWVCLDDRLMLFDL